MTERDRRDAERQRIRLLGHVRVGNQVYGGELLDLCENGCSFAMPIRLTVGTDVQVRFSHPDSGNMVSGAAVVVRHIDRTGADAPRDGLGLRFQEPLSTLDARSARGETRHTSRPLSPAKLRDAIRRGVVTAPSMSRIQGVTQGPNPRRARTATPPSGRTTTTAGELAVNDTPRRHQSRPKRYDAPARRIRFVCGAAEFVGPGSLVDISRKGLSVQCDAPPRVGDLVRVEIEDPHPSRLPLRVAGRVVWARSDGSGPPAFGVSVLEHLGVGALDRYREFISLIHQTESQAGTLSF